MRRQDTRRETALLLVAMTLLLQACSIGGTILTEARTDTALADDEVIIVGTIELVPRLTENEQVLDAPRVIDLFGYGEMNRNRTMLQLNDRPEADDHKVVINPELGTTFFFTVPRRLKYIVGGWVLMELDNDTGRMLLPAWFKIDINPRDKAVYIGKIRYRRDDFNSIIGLEVVDDYRSAVNHFRKKFGRKYELRKSLIEKI